MSKSTQESKATGAQTKSPGRVPQQPVKSNHGQSTAERVLSLQHSAGNQAVNSLVAGATSKRSADGSELTGAVDFRLPQATRAERPQDNRYREWQMLGPRKQAFALRAPNGSLKALEKDVEGGKGKKQGNVVEQDAGGGSGGAAGGGGAAPAPPAKKAGVSSFTVKWKKNAAAGATKASLRLDYHAKFKKDAAHDPALAEFRQNVMTKMEITAGPHKGSKADTSPMHDDNYSRADDTAGNALTDTEFESNDNPGIAFAVDATDDVDYAFTAEQMIIDTSRSNAVIAQRGPHTGTIKGVHPRRFGGVPKTLS